MISVSLKFSKITIAPINEEPPRIQKKDLGLTPM